MCVRVCACVCVRVCTFFFGYVYTVVVIGEVALAAQHDLLALWKPQNLFVLVQEPDQTKCAPSMLVRVSRIAR